MELRSLEHELSVCKVASMSDIDLSSGFFFVARTQDELSLVCLTEDVPPETIAREDGWRGFVVKGPLDFSLVGILHEISSILAGTGIAIFAVSTFDTDYVLVRSEDFTRACHALARAGHTVA